MQAFSDLQRDIARKNYTKLVVVGIALVAWVSLSTLNPYLPPLFGLVCVAVYTIDKREFTVLALIYLTFFEADRSYFILSSWPFLWMIAFSLLPFIARGIECKKCMLVGGIVLSYVLFFVYLRILEGFLHATLSPIAYAPIAVYIAVESLLALLLES